MQYDSTLGAGYIGCIFVSILYGVTCVQTFIYTQHCKKDNKLLKSAVAFLWVLDTLHALFVIMSLYWYTITHFTDSMIIFRIPWMIPGGVLLTTPISDAVVRTFFIYRIWILSNKNRLLVYPLIFLALIVFGIGLGFGIKGVSFTDFAHFARLAWLLYFGLGLLFFVDGYVSLSLIILLYRSRRGFSTRTDSIINIMILYTINTGLLTSLSALACLIMYAATPTNYIFLALYFPLSKLYLNAFLATLNARDALRSVMVSGTPVSIPLSATAGNGRPRTGLVFKSFSTQLESAITVEQDIYVRSDSDMRSSHHEQGEN